MLTVIRDGIKVEIPSEIRAKGSGAVDAYVDKQIGEAPREESEADGYVTRTELDNMARGLGVVEPEKLPNKSAVEEAIATAKAK